METTRIAVLMTCHNRREKTLASLASLDRQRGLSAGRTLSVHLVDAGSSDGTAQAVGRRFPDVEVMSVGTDVFWGEGMRLASRNSQNTGLPPWKYQLWLNDDVVLDDDALAELLGTADRLPEPAVVVGAVHASDGPRTTYSGRRRVLPRWHPRSHNFALVEPTGRPEPCDTCNGNVVLVPRVVHDRIGDIDRHFKHSMGDYDYGLRAHRAGIPIYVAPRHVGSCDTNPPGTGSRTPGIGVREALRRVTSRRELPVPAWAVYCNRHLWPWAPVLMCSPYLMTAVRALTGGHGERGR